MACRVVGWIYRGWHTFISHALAGGRTLAEVKAAAGHASVLTTSVYLHVVVDKRHSKQICSRDTEGYTASDSLTVYSLPKSN